MSAVLVERSQQMDLPAIPELPKWIKRTEIGIEIKKRVSFEEWAGAFEILHKTEKGHQWQIGDMLNEGEQRFGDDCYQVIDPDEELLRDDEGRGETYRSYQWVAQKIPSVHRCTKVPWTIHRDVAAMDAKDRDYWLARAESEKLSRRALQKAIKETKKSPVIKLSEALQAIHDRAVREDLELTIAAIRERDQTPVDPLLSTLNRLIIERLEWQRDRTIDGDISKIVEAVDDGCWTGQDIFDWLHTHLCVMSDEQFDDRIEQAIEKGKIEFSKQGGKGERARGDRTAMYVLHGARSGDAYNSHRVNSIYSQGESD